MSGKSTQKVIKVDEGLWDRLDEWLKTDDAKKLGYHSKAQFATEAVRKLLDKYSIVTLSEHVLKVMTRDYQNGIKTGEIDKNISYEGYVLSRLKIGIRPDERTEYRT